MFLGDKRSEVLRQYKSTQVLLVNQHLVLVVYDGRGLPPKN